MFGRGKQQDGPHQVESADPVAPFVSGAFRTDWSPRPVGKRGKTRPFVRVGCGGVAGDLHGVDLRALVRRESGIVNSHTQPTLFLCWPEAAAPSSVAEEWVRDLPRDSVAVLVAPMTAPPLVVLDRAAIDAFAAWLDDLPF